jgi:hypothetical protein
VTWVAVTDVGTSSAGNWAPAASWTRRSRLVAGASTTVRSGKLQAAGHPGRAENAGQVSVPSVVPPRAPATPLTVSEHLSGRGRALG